MSIEIEQGSTRDVDQARALTDRIKSHVEQAWELIVEAYQGRAWIALGYSTWDDYCLQEFGSCRIRLPREERTDVVASLRDAGMTTRAIASATGFAYGTVQSEIVSISRDQNRSPGPETIVGIDGKHYQPQRQIVDREARIEQLRRFAQEGLTINEIAERLSISTQRVSTIAREYGVTLRGTQSDREARIEIIRSEAARGATSRQLSAQLGVSAVRVRELAREHQIEIHADALTRSTRRIDHTRVVRAAVEDTYGTGALLDQIDWAQVDMSDGDDWLSALNQAIRALSALRQAIQKEMRNRD